MGGGWRSRDATAGVRPVMEPSDSCSFPTLDAGGGGGQEDRQKECTVFCSPTGNQLRLARGLGCSTRPSLCRRPLECSGDSEKDGRPILTLKLRWSTYLLPHSRRKCLLTARPMEQTCGSELMADIEKALPSGKDSPFRTKARRCSADLPRPAPRQVPLPSPCP